MVLLGVEGGVSGSFFEFDNGVNHFEFLGGNGQAGVMLNLNTSTLALGAEAHGDLMGYSQNHNVYSSDTFNIHNKAELSVGGVDAVAKFSVTLPMEDSTSLDFGADVGAGFAALDVSQTFAVNSTEPGNSFSGSTTISGGFGAGFFANTGNVDYSSESKGVVFNFGSDDFGFDSVGASLKVLTPSGGLGGSAFYKDTADAKILEDSFQPFRDARSFTERLDSDPTFDFSGASGYSDLGGGQSASFVDRSRLISRNSGAVRGRSTFTGRGGSVIRSSSLTEILFR